jgi:hypothetical protein
MIYSKEPQDYEVEGAQCTFYEQKGAAGTTEGFVYLRIGDFRTQIISYVWVDDLILAADCPLFSTRASFFEYLQLNKVWGGLLCDGTETVVVPDYDVPGSDALPLTFSQVQDQIKIHPFRFTTEG